MSAETVNKVWFSVGDLAERWGVSTHVVERRLLSKERDPEGAAERSNARERYVAHMEIGEHVEIVKGDGTRIKAQFWEARGNKVILRTLPVS